MKKKQSAWEIGTQLATEVQAKDFKAAEKNFHLLINIFYKDREEPSFEEVKLRTLQVLTNVNRAAYYAGANPDRLFHINIDVINQMIKIKTKRQLSNFAKRILKKSISLVPDKDFPGTEKLNKAIGYIREHCTENFSRQTVAEVIDCSPSHLSRIFSNVTGHTFKEVVLKYKMEKAKEILGRSKYSITEIAYEVGYNDPNYFSATFKRVVGITPSRYRSKITR